MPIMEKLSEEKLQILCEEVQALSMRVGAYIREERKKFQPSQIEKKSFNNLVSYVDRTAEEKFVAALKEIFPEAGFITEEDSSRTRAENFNWIIDPLDGTTNFVHGFPCFATSVALVENDVPVVGVIYEINQDECFYGWKNGGAWLNGKQIHISQTASLKESLVGTGFPYHDYGLLKKYLHFFSELLQNSQGVRRPGSAATDIAYVACGRFDAFCEYGLNSWDIAAGTVLVREAGGVVTDFKGGNDFLFGKSFACGNKTVHKELLEKINLHFLQ